MLSQSGSRDIQRLRFGTAVNNPGISKDFSMWYANVVGYGFALAVGGVLVKNVVDTLWNCLAPEGSKNPQIRPGAWQPEALGHIERILYVALLQAGQAALIGLWLALKVVGKWTKWGESGDEKTQKPSGQSIFNVFLIGNALSLVYAFAGFKLIGWIATGRLARGCWVSIAVVVLTLLLWSWLHREHKLPKPVLDPATGKNPQAAT
jgi:hypothetical protein